MTGADDKVGPETSFTIMLKVLSFVPLIFVALNVADNVVAVAGMPEIVPVEESSVRGLIPPPTIDHVIGVAPVAERV